QMIATGGQAEVVNDVGDEMRGPNFHQGRRFASKRCDYTGAPPFANPYRMCEWCAGTGHPHGDESYGMCECPDLLANDQGQLTAPE
ncbi:MAG: hypothetical protein ACPG32_15385, partial [Akkermansiaceae bacterium]